MTKAAFRNLWKNRRLGFINITGLTIGMGSAFLILLWVQNEFSFDGYQPDAKREYLITWMDKNNEINADSSPFPLALTAAQSISGLDGITCYFPHGVKPLLLHVNTLDWTEKKFIYADANWFRLFHFDFLSGSAAEFGVKNGVILTATLAERYFGRSPAVGQIITIDSTDYSVLGVIRDNPTNSSFQFDLFIPLKAYFKDPSRAFVQTNWRSFTARTFIRLRTGTPSDECTRQLNALMKANTQGDETAKLIPLAEMHFGVGLSSAEITYGDKKAAIIMGCLGALVLLIACINYVNLATVSASVRLKEISMKKIMGVGRFQLFFQFMGEALLTGLLALFLMVVLIWLTLPLFDQLSETPFVVSFGNIGILTLLLGVWFLTILLTGVYPAILLSAKSPLRLLRSEYSPDTTNTWVRKTFIVIQFVAAITLIISTIVIVAQLHYIENQNEGYDRTQIFSVDLPSSSWFKQNAKSDKESMLKAFKTELKRQAGIDNATYVTSSVIDMSFSMSGIADWAGRDPNFNPQVYPFSVDTDFRRLFPLQLVAGQWFSRGDIQGKHMYILNETAVKTFGLHNPVVGQRFILMGDTGQIIGIVKDFHFRSFHEKIAPIVVVKDAPYKSMLFVKVPPHGTAQAIRRAEQVFHRFFPGQLFEYTFLDEAFDQLYRSDIRTSELAGCFAGIAVFLSCLGLLGLAAFTARQREKEIATRKVLGASVGDIIGRLSGEFLRLVIVSLLIACPIALWAMHKWLEGFVYRTEIAWWMFVLSGCVALGIAFLSVAAQAVKAAIASPVKSLRNQ